MMKEETVPKIISILEQSGSETVALYAERAVTDGVVSVIVGTMILLVLYLSFIFMHSRFERSDLDLDVKTPAYFLFFIFGGSAFILGLIFMFDGWATAMHPEAEAIEKLIKQIRGD